MKKFLSLLCSLALLMSLTVMPASAETVDLSKPLEIELMAYYVMDIPEDDPIMNYLEEKFNVEFKLNITNINNYNNTLNMLVASDDTPDWFRIQDAGIYRQMAEDGLLVDVGAYVEKYNFENIRASLNLPNANSLLVNGNAYCVPDTVGKLTGGIYYRADWLEELGLEAPTTYDELRTVLEKIVEADPDGMGTCGFTFYYWNQVEQYMLPAWTGFLDWGAKEDGSLLWKYEDEGYKEFMKYMAGLYADKLLDQEIFINNYEVCMEKLATGRAGFYIMNLNTTWWTNNKNGLAQFDPEAKLGALVPGMAGPEGELIGTFLGTFQASSSFNANVGEEKIARMLAIMDYLLSDEGRDLTLYGYEEGVYYDLVDGVKIQKEDVVTKEWGQTLHFMGEIADFGTNDRLAIDPELIAWNEYLDGDTALYPKLDSFSDATATSIMAELKEIVSRYRTSWLSGEMDVDATWEEFQALLDGVGIDEYRALLADYVEQNNIQVDKVP